MPRVYPTAKEQRVGIGEVLIKKHENFKQCQRGEWKAFSVAKQITFTHQYITFLDKHNEWKHYDLNEWFVEIYSHDVKITTSLLCRVCKQNTVKLESKYDVRKCEYYQHSAKCLSCGDTCYPTGMLPFLLSHWDEEAKSYKAPMPIKEQTEFANQINIFEILEEYSK